MRYMLITDGRRTCFSRSRQTRRGHVSDQRRRLSICCDHSRAIFSKGIQRVLFRFFFCDTFLPLGEHRPVSSDPGLIAFRGATAVAEDTSGYPPKAIRLCCRQIKYEVKIPALCTGRILPEDTDHIRSSVSLYIFYRVLRSLLLYRLSNAINPDHLLCRIGLSSW